MKRRWCADWPDCECSLRLGGWQQDLLDEVEWTPEQCELVRELSFVRLACIAANAPDRAARVWASKQMSHPVYYQEWLAMRGL
jgi:hypothetical protein